MPHVSILKAHLRPRLGLLALALCASPVLAQGGPPGGGPAIFNGLPPVQAPFANPTTLAKVRLGTAIFWDEQLSSAGTVACGTCHIPSAGGGDPRSKLSSGSQHPGADGVFGTQDDVTGSLGVPSRFASGAYAEDPSFGFGPQVTGRKAPTMINAAFFDELFWDGRADSSFEDPLTGQTVSSNRSALESQAADPPLSTVEMGHIDADWGTLADRFASARPLRLAQGLPADLGAWIADRSYPELFQEAFGSADVTPTRMAQALATYQRSLISNQAPVDDGPQALTQQQSQGLQVFNGPGRCVICHTGPRLADDRFHNTGVSPLDADLGRFLVTNAPPDRGRFKTPGLRNIGLRGPFFHDGSAETLADVVDFYVRGGDFGVNQSPLMQPLNLNPGQRAALIAFLEGALLDPRVAAEIGPFARPTLWSESNLAPQSIGAGTPGSGGLVPRMVAQEPAYTGNPDFTLHLSRALPGSIAVLGLDSQGIEAGLPFGGTTSYLSLGPSLILADVLPTQTSLDGSGHASGVLAVPELPQLAGVEFYGQWFVIDAAATGGLSASEATRFTVF